MRYRTRPALPTRRDAPPAEASALTMTRRGARLGFRLVRRGKTYRWVRAFESAEEARDILRGAFGDRVD